MTSTRIGVALLIGSIAILVPASAGAARDPAGLFIEPAFVPPDFANGDSATVTSGEIRTFTASCTCARQPGTAPCAGSVAVQASNGLSWSDLGSNACAADEGQSCSAAFTRIFDAPGTFFFRVYCDETDGTDGIHDPAKVVTITVEEPTPTCSSGETRPCPLQEGVCAGSMETCVGGEWQPCDYGMAYEEVESTCGDGLDTDCDGIPVCGGEGVVNELFLSEVNATSSLEVYEYRDGIYREVWSTRTADTNGTGGGGEAGDLTGDGIPEIVLQRITGTSANRIEVWTLDPRRPTWYRLWAGPEQGGYYLMVGDIIDADLDGDKELLISDYWNHQLVLYGWNGVGLEVQSVVQECPNERGALFIATAGDLDGDGTPEILYQCDTPDPIIVHEFDGQGFAEVGRVDVPINLYGLPMIVDDMETADVNHDGRADAVFCGNSGQVHVLSHLSGTYLIEYSSDPPSQFGVFSQTCSAGDVTGDGLADIVVVNSETVQVHTFNEGTGYSLLWSDGPVGITPGLGSSFVGDADNDGRGEFLWGRPIGAGYHLYESDDVPASEFEITSAFGTIWGGGSIIVADLDPTNNRPPVDCDDSDPEKGGYEICGDGIDNNCDGSTDEQCDLSYCGDNVCGGLTLGESCTSCPDDCGCLGPGCRHGCCGDGVCGKLESPDNCPVDCR
ncbi:MAG: FG-GAP-like repeat-containing protein [Thermoanaerobaculales bacterium]|nr:FG-GAP-like repeat-containing protein [Thermoanaerobaculales bacterium]